MARLSTAPSSPLAMSPIAGNGDDVPESSLDASSSSVTPPTSLGDNASEADAPKGAERRRSTRERNSIVTYNDKVNAGTAVHTRRSFLNDTEPSSRNVSGATLVEYSIDSPGKHSSHALNMDWSPSTNNKSTVKAAERKNASGGSTASHGLGPLASKLASAVTSTTSVLAKQAGNAANSARKSMRGLVKGPQKRPAQKSRGPIKRKAFVDEELSESPSSEESEDDEEEEELQPKRKQPKLVQQGLYYGAARHLPQPKDSKQAMIAMEFGQYDNTLLPLPMGVGQRLFEEGRDFKLPFNILNPHPNDQAPRDWHRLNKNRFIGDAAGTWKKNAGRLPSSTCTCDEESGCQENCLNRMMQYECNDDNCNSPARCLNRPFAELKWRSRCKNQYRNMGPAESNMWGEGVEVIKTGDRGYGVRAMRSFRPGQVIVEYCGEIITQEEADRRMNNEYKGKTDYYLMTFHDRLIIDATRGSICRFVNHSCEPNCRVEKWTVAGEPRMALFAGDAGIMTGDELTYDYNFDPFSEKNVQKCLCGARNCRGVIGPKPAKERMKEQAKKLVTKAGKGLKRKIKQVLGNDVADSEHLSPRKKARTDPKTLLNKLGKQITNKASSKASASPRTGHKDGRKARRQSAFDSLGKVSDSRVEKRRSSGQGGSPPKKGSVQRGWTGWALLPKGQQRPKTAEEELRELIEKAKSEGSKRTTKPRSHKEKLEHTSAKKPAERDGSAPSTVAELYKKKRASLLGRSTAEPSNSASSATAKLLGSESNLRQSTLSFGSGRLSLDSGLGSSSPPTRAHVRSASGKYTNSPKDSSDLDVLRDGSTSKSTPPHSPRARPTTAQSVAASIKHAAVYSIKGSHRAAAMLKVGLQGDEAIRKTIRHVSGAE